MKFKVIFIDLFECLIACIFSGFTCGTIWLVFTFPKECIWQTYKYILLLYVLCATYGN